MRIGSRPRPCRRATWCGSSAAARHWRAELTERGREQLGTARTGQPANSINGKDRPPLTARSRASGQRRQPSGARIRTEASCRRPSSWSLTDRRGRPADPARRDSERGSELAAARLRRAAARQGPAASGCRSPGRTPASRSSSRGRDRQRARRRCRAGPGAPEQVPPGGAGVPQPNEPARGLAQGAAARAADRARARQRSRAPRLRSSPASRVREDSYGRSEWKPTQDGQLVFTINGHELRVRIWEKGAGLRGPYEQPAEALARRS